MLRERHSTNKYKNVMMRLLWNKYICNITSWPDPNTWLSWVSHVGVTKRLMWTTNHVSIDRCCNENILLQGEKVIWNIIIVAFNWILAIHRFPGSVFSILCNYPNCPEKLGTAIFILQMGNLKLWFAQGLNLSR